MKRLDWRIVIGAAFVLLGALMFLERLGLVPGAVETFWGAVFLPGAAYFLDRFAESPQSEWWAAIPGFALAGLGMEALLPRFLGSLHGLFFLGALGVGFFAVYLIDQARWWAIIPGGVLITLGLIAVFSSAFGVADSGGLLFVGIGVTFLLVAILANKSWAYIPGVILLAFGALLGAAFPGAAGLFWPAALVAAGLIIIVRFLRNT
jgi:hypothetical protein